MFILPDYVTSSHGASLKTPSLLDSLQHVFKIIPGAIAVLDKYGTYLMVEGNAIKRMKLKPEDFVGKNVFEFRRHSPRIVENIKRCLAGETFCAEIFVNDVWFETWHIPIRGDDGAIDFIIAYSFEITDRKRAEEKLKVALEQAEARNEAKTNFLSHASHEIRTPMTSILGFTEILRKADLNQNERNNYLERIDRGGKTLLKLIDDLLDISHMETGRVEIHKRRVILMDWLNEIISFLEVMAQRKGLCLELIYEGTCPKTIYTDVDRTRQILTNLVGNAIKFTEKGSIKIIVRAKTGNGSTDDILEFTVLDTGPGISKENQQKIFKPFEQADASVKGKYGGSGLGLSISKQWAERLGGSLELLHSEPGEGTSFLARVKAGPFEFLN